MKGFWAGRSQAAKLDLYMRVTLYALPWFISFGLMAPLPTDLVREPGPIALVQGLMAVVLVQCAFSMHAMSRGLAHRLHGAPAPWRSAAVALVLGGISVALVVILQATGGLSASNTQGAGMIVLLGYGLFPTMLSVYALSTTRWLVLWTVVAAALVAVAAGVGTQRFSLGVGSALAVILVGAFGLLAYRSSLWFVAVIWELDRARDAQARLAVAEERLRFGRDLHDVMGRNLAVIALKSELALQLARRGRPEAAEQMAEVQRIARESQREVREVVRGYREADLRTEIEGARGVLAAAGISCLVTDGVGTDLPAGVQSALGWVVREATTNVLRHGNPKSCTLHLTAHGERAVLVVENDGAPAQDSVGASATPGTGLAGLRERLAAVGGTLTAGPVGDGMFRVTAEVPLTDPGVRTDLVDKEVKNVSPESARQSARASVGSEKPSVGTEAGAA